jgi:hypothetical protein
MSVHLRYTKFLPSQEDLPVIDEKYDIYSINDLILKHLEDRFSKIENLQKKIKKLEWIRDNSDSELEKKDSKQEIFFLKRDLNLISDRKEIIEYIEKTKDIIQEYKDKKPKKFSFVFSNNDEEILKECKNIMKKYLYIAQNYIKIKTREVPQNIIVCEKCKNNNFELIDDHIYCCLTPDCGRCIEINDDKHSYRDIDRINMSSRYHYTKKGHFKEAIEKFQAKQNTTIEKSVYDMIKEEMKKHKISAEKLSEDQIHLFLQEHKGCSKHYEDIKLIHCTLNETVKPHDISHLERELYDMFDQQEEIYEQIIKDTNKKNTLNVYYKLFKLLEIKRYPCRYTDFPMLKYRDKIVDHDEIWKKICDRLGWTFYPTT